MAGNFEGLKYLSGFFFGIKKMLIKAQGSIEQAVEQFKSSKLKKNKTCVHARL